MGGADGGRMVRSIPTQLHICTSIHLNPDRRPKMKGDGKIRTVNGSS